MSENRKGYMQEGKAGKNKKGKTLATCAIAAVVIAVLCAVAFLINMNCNNADDIPPADSNAEKETTVFDRISGIFRNDEEDSPDVYTDANGEYEGNEYNNGLFGIAAVFDGGWYFFDSQTREGITANTYGMYGKTDEGAAVYDLYCEEKEKGYSISIVIENCETLYGKRLTEEEYIEKAQEALKSEDMESSGVMIASVEKKDGASGLGDHSCIEVTG